MEEKKTTTPRTNKKPTPVVHLQPGSCPGQEYFERKEREEDDRLKTILAEVLGDVPMYMRIAGENRIWLWLITFITLIDTGLIISMIVTISRMPK